jgi:general secretion pathway protein A
MRETPQSAIEYFGLREHPFAATADPAYFYAARQHKECLFRLWSNIDERQGIAVVLGHYGTGKTTLLRKLLSGMAADPEGYTTAVIGSPIPSWTSFSLLESIVSQFGLQPERRSYVSHMEALYAFLLRNRGRINTLIIDDAQNLNKRGQLELLRLVQNLETPQHKLLNLVLLAQMEWVPVLRAVPNFEQRVGMTFRLGPLAENETRRLISFRLRQAGVGDDGPVLDDAAIRLIHSYADGSPRLIVSVCRNALLLAAQIKTRRIGQAIILHTIQQTTLPDQERQARVKEAIQPETPPSPPRVEELEERPVVRRTSRSYNNRANEMLMNAARATQERATFPEVDEDQSTQ